MLQLSMKPTGWFHIGWSEEIPNGGVKPLRYFGQDLVAFRTEDGALGVLDAHCRHLGAHLGYDSAVKGGCVVCPYHGWEWDREGNNTLVPYQDHPTRAKMRSWAVDERNGLMWMWHDPAGGPPRADFLIPDLFEVFESAPATEDEYYPCYSQATIDKPNEPIHPQLVMENSADCTHFKFTHSAQEFPKMQSFDVDGTVWRSQMAFISPKTKEPTLFLENYNTTSGVTAALFTGKNVNYRLLLSATPIDDERSDLRVSYFFPRNGDTGDTLPPELASFAAHTVELFEEDARIWRHQAFVQKPIYALDDRAAYSALRKWSEQFYEAPEGQRVMTVVEESMVGPETD